MSKLQDDWTKVADLRHQSGHAVDLFFSGLTQEFKVRVHSVKDSRFEEDVFKGERYDGQPTAIGLHKKDLEKLGKSVDLLILELA